MGALSNKSFVMAVMVVEAFKQLQAQNEFVLSKQLLRSGTSVGAMVRESEFAQSK
ncbi:MAG: four helix bundle protein, partial [Flavobacteriales bacterium]|nr:four helix bundle protein [Flavobacteriales bacterium]